MQESKVGIKTLVVLFSRYRDTLFKNVNISSQAKAYPGRDGQRKIKLLNTGNDTQKEHMKMLCDSRITNLTGEHDEKIPEERRKKWKSKHRTDYDDENIHLTGRPT